MEPAKIDWKTLDSKFVQDELYEHIQAPQWVDLNAPQEFVDDEAWFCRPDCKHPKTVEDFLASTPNSKNRSSVNPAHSSFVMMKILRSADKSETLPQGDWNRSTKVKRRGLVHHHSSEFTEESENQNPNLSTPPRHQYKTMKTKSSSEKKKEMEPRPGKEGTPKLKSTLSASNLFAGRDLLSQISEFCHEIKKLATRAKEGENTEKLNQKGAKEKEKERKPLLEVGKERSHEKKTTKDKLRKKRENEAENMTLDLKNVKQQQSREENVLQQIRTCPPTPQCFSAARGPNKSTPPQAAARPGRMERGMLQEIEQNNYKGGGGGGGDRVENGTTVSVIAEREAKSMDMFWFLKPCTLSS